MKKKLILFDWGNIVESHTTGYSCPMAWNDLFKKCGYTGTNNIFDLLGKYNLSSISNTHEFKKVYNQMASEFNFNVSYSKFTKIYKDLFNKIDYYQEVSNYEKSLKEKCYIGILSNLTIFDKERLDKQVNLKEYDYVFLSFEMKLKKPNIEIYEAVQKQLTFSKKDILFIDDQSDNIKIAKLFGWNTLQATGLELDLIKKTCEDFLQENI